METNPITVAALGSRSEQKPEALDNFFRLALQGVGSRGVVLGAFDSDDQIVGVCGITHPGKCQPTSKEKLVVARVLLQNYSLKTMFKVLGWVREWSKHDPKTPHWHLGPLAVHPNHQGKGVGDLLLTEVCKLAEDSGAPVYLETDRKSNVGFYEKRGFRVIGQSTILGIENWYMIFDQVKN
ncbi:MAG: GNAT family N-acetyltransferase [Fimbriimonadaceae bacterium]|nr:MAG: GNAT family N-acetyltransferase [Fimbriimonadaceae bacterium]